MFLLKRIQQLPSLLQIQEGNKSYKRAISPRLFIMHEYLFLHFTSKFQLTVNMTVK
jgi:hypothetical protein